jgi:dipeptidase D
VEFKKWFESKQKDLSENFRENEPLLKIEVTTSDFPQNLLSDDLQTRLLHSLTECPHGIMPGAGYGKSGRNLNQPGIGKIHRRQPHYHLHQSAKFDRHPKESSCIKGCFRFLNYKADIKQGNGYPGWKPNPGSEILK